MITITAGQLASLAPRAHSAYVAAFAAADSVLARHGINENAKRLAHFLAQVLHESGGLTVLREDMNYRTAARIRAVWPARFPTLAAARPYVKNPTGLANKVYNGRMGNRPGSNDGYDFRGRGLLQVTGRGDYVKYGSVLGIDLVGNPELAIDPRYTLEIAALEWTAKQANKLADADDLAGVTRKINGGQIGLSGRRRWYAKVQTICAISRTIG